MKVTSSRPALDFAQFDHMGIPTDESREGEVYLPDDGVWITNPRELAANVEFVRHSDKSRMHELIKTRPHVAYRVESLTPFLESYEVLSEPFVIPESGVEIAFVEIDGVVVELLSFANKDQEEWVV